MTLDRNHVYNLNCLDGIRQMIAQDMRVDCVITDPPYLIDYKTHHRKDKQHKFCKAIQGDTDPQLIIDLIPLLFDVMKENTPLYMFCGCDKVDFFKQQVERYFTIKNLIIWDKGNHTAGDLDAQYGKRYEIIIYANKGRAPFNPEMPRYDDIWKYNKVTGEKQIHQNQKPTDLLSRIIRQHTREGDLILDAFAGSCSTAIAAYRLQRDYIAFEISPTEYADGTQWLDTVRSQVSIFDLIKGGTI